MRTPSLQSPDDGRSGFSGSSPESSKVGPKLHPAGLGRRIRSLVRAIQENDDAKIEQAILHLSSSRRVFAPLAFAIGAFALLYNALRLLVTNWRLTVAQILPACGFGWQCSTSRPTCCTASRYTS